jgi:hypothetical protein
VCPFNAVAGGLIPVLREIRNTRQIEGEPDRKWYFCEELDLVVWFDDSGNPMAFQLAYGKPTQERSFSWHPQRGYRHFTVDDGESPSKRKGSPLLFANGPFTRNDVLRKFMSLSVELPPAVQALVSDKLQSFHGNP